MECVQMDQRMKEIRRKNGLGEPLPDAVQRVIDAATWANFCPSEGGYRDGRSVEDCYEELNAALNDFYGTDLEHDELGWITEAELDETLRPKLDAAD
jgi:hypothetical protein